PVLRSPIFRQENESRADRSQGLRILGACGKTGLGEAYRLLQVIFHGVGPRLGSHLQETHPLGESQKEMAAWIAGVEFHVGAELYLALREASLVKVGESEKDLGVRFRRHLDAGSLSGGERGKQRRHHGAEDAREPSHFVLLRWRNRITIAR